MPAPVTTTFPGDGGMPVDPEEAGIRAALNHFPEPRRRSAPLDAVTGGGLILIGLPGSFYWRNGEARSA